MKYVKNTQGFSLVLALGLTLLMSFTALYVLEYMIPFSRNVSGIENATSSFYQSLAGIENALYVQSNSPIGYESTKNYVASNPRDFNYTITASGSSIPRQSLNEGTSTDSITSQLGNWNKLSLQEPIQVLVGSGRIISPPSPRYLNIQVQVPDFDKNGSRDILSSSGSQNFVMWQLSSTTNSISSTGSSFTTLTNITNSTDKSLMDSTTPGVLKDGSSGTFLDFYDMNCLIVNECVLKISLIRDLIRATNETKLPYLEYKLTTSRPIPLQSSLITSSGKSYGFSKTLEVQIPQLRTNAAFDFTLFQ